MRRKILVIVGTHEQQFDRLVKASDALAKNHDVFIQSGYSDYQPQIAEFEKMVSFKKIETLTKWADIIITHGGPGSILDALKIKKVPIVIPREKKYGEHVNDHQVQFAEYLKARQKIISTNNIEELEKMIDNYEKLTKDILVDSQFNTKEFTKKLEELTISLIDTSKKK